MKNILLSLFVGLIGLINFGYCGYSTISAGSLSLSARETLNNFLADDSRYYNKDLFCMMNDGGTSCNFTAYYGSDSVSINQLRMVGCLSGIDINSSQGVRVVNNSSSLCTAKFIVVEGTTIYPELTSNQCKAKYNLMSISDYTSLNCENDFGLIPVSSVDQNYCVNNGLCPSSGGDCPVCPGSGDNWSALYINDIQHLGKPIINITFPDYLDWDYTTTENEFNLNIEGYPVDTEYIDGIIRTQNYKPTSEDFTQLVGMLAPYSKYLLFLLFIFIIWAWIKKPFKSKKL